MSSHYNFNSSIAQAFLPTKGMKFSGAGDARVHDWAPAGSPAGSNVTSLRQRAAATQLAGSYSNVPSTTNNTSDSPNAAGGSISGGALRPGAVDQTQFKAMLNAASAGVPGANIGANSPLPAAPSTGLAPLVPNAALAAQGLQPASPASFNEMSAAAAAGASTGVQTLTSAQFAALTGGVNLPAGTAPATSAPNTSAGVPPAQAPAAAVPAQQIASANNLTMSDAAIPPDAPAENQTPQSQTALATPATPDTLTMSDAAIPPDGADQPQQQASAVAGNPDESDPTPFGSTDKNGVLVLNQIPDRETRQEYAEKGIKWRITDNPASNKLFFGPDGKFGWDDVLDIVNPLQHIPLVNIAYRHFTGDQMNGSAELLGGVAFGPVAALGAIADLAVKSITGKDIGENAIAMLTGDHDDPVENLAQAQGKAVTTTADAVTTSDAAEPGNMHMRNDGRG